MAISPLLKAVYRMATSGDDVARVADDVVGAVRNIAPKKQAVARMADEVVEKADDWGWKGGKPGEFTGTEFRKIQEDYSPQGERVYNDTVEKLVDKFENLPAKSSTYATYARLKSRYAPFHGIRSAARQAAAELQETYGRLEKANVPREYTGKLANAILQRTSGITSVDNAVAKKLSTALEGMTNDQRETFLSLLPEWADSLDELVETARTL